MKAFEEGFRTIGKGFATYYPASDNATALMQDEGFAWIIAIEHPGWLW